MSDLDLDFILGDLRFLNHAPEAPAMARSNAEAHGGPAPGFHQPAVLPSNPVPSRKRRRDQGPGAPPKGQPATALAGNSTRTTTTKSTDVDTLVSRFLSSGRWNDLADDTGLSPEAKHARTLSAAASLGLGPARAPDLVTHVPATVSPSHGPARCPPPHRRRDVAATTDTPVPVGTFKQRRPPPLVIMEDPWAHPAHANEPLRTPTPVHCDFAKSPLLVTAGRGLPMPRTPSMEFS